MKQTVFVIGAVLWTVGMAYGQAETPRIDQRQANQEQRIDQGMASGQLTPREADCASTSSNSTSIRWRIRPSPMES